MRYWPVVPILLLLTVVFLIFIGGLAVADDTPCPPGMTRVKTNYGSICSSGPSDPQHPEVALGGVPAFIDCKTSFDKIDFFAVRPSFLQQVKPVGSASCGEKVLKLVRDDQYTKIRTAGGVEGYLLSGFLVDTPVDERCRRLDVCVRPIYPLPNSATQIVVGEFKKQGVEACACGKEFQKEEVWFYPLNFAYSSGETTSWVTVNPTQNGAIVQVETLDPAVVNGMSWEMALHPNGGVWTAQRYQGTSLKSEAGRMGKWIRKHYKDGNR